MVAASLTPARVMRGMSNPWFTDLISRIALLLGVDPSLLIPTLCENALAVISSTKIVKRAFVVIFIYI